MYAGRGGRGQSSGLSTGCGKIVSGGGTRGIARSSTLPMMARPRPPLGAHSSFATRSSLFERIIFHSVVTCWPAALGSVLEGKDQIGDRKNGKRPAHNEAVNDALCRKQRTLARVLRRPHKGIGRHSKEVVGVCDRERIWERRGAEESSEALAGLYTFRAGNPAHKTRFPNAPSKSVDRTERGRRPTRNGATRPGAGVVGRNRGAFSCPPAAGASRGGVSSGAAFRSRLGLIEKQRHEVAVSAADGS